MFEISTTIDEKTFSEINCELLNHYYFSSEAKKDFFMISDEKFIYNIPIRN
jgi:hypothetical protein